MEQINTLHGLWEIALEDLKKCADDYTRFTINMNLYYENRGGYCQVCAAGAVIAQRFKPSRRLMCPSDFEPRISTRLRAIDYLRRGALSDAWSTLHGTSNDDFSFPMPDYGDPNWWSRAEELLVYLKENNL